MFLINGIEWKIKFVHGASNKLMRSDGSTSLAVTDWNDRAIYVSDKPKNGYLRKILAHELCHCFCFSYNIHMPIEPGDHPAADALAGVSAMLCRFQIHRLECV